MSDDWPAWATGPVSIRDADPGWRRLAAELTADLDQRLAPWLDGSVEHVGSTSVPGLAAKPVVDLMAPVRSLPASEEADAVLAGRGWHLVPPDLDQRPWRRLYVLPEGDRRLAHLHLVESDHPRWHDALAFRDHLRREPELAAAYERLKREAARRHGTDREVYTEAKSAFVEAVLRRQR